MKKENIKLKPLQDDIKFINDTVIHEDFIKNDKKASNKLKKTSFDDVVFWF